MSNITEPLRLATGSHKAGSGKGCAMNVISWENGDRTITDYPECSDRFLARVVQQVNDTLCRHGDRGGGLLCPDCSVKVLKLAHRTVGTNIGPAARPAWVRIAREEADSVADLRSATYASAAADAAADSAAYAAAAAAYAAYAAAAAADHRGARLRRAHSVIDRFYAYTGLLERPAPEPVVVQEAVHKMLEVSA